MITLHEFFTNHNWGQGTLYSRFTDSYCMLGGIHKISNTGEEKQRLTNAVAEACKKEFGITFIAIANDNRIKSKEQLLAFLLKHNL